MKTFADLKAKYPRLIHPGFLIECHEGWLSILDRYFEVVERELSPKIYELRQVKEKLGSLRIYDHGEATSSSVPIRNAHALAEARSFYTCEYCGKRGVWSNRRGYLTTVCEDHAVLDGYRAEPYADSEYTYRETDGIWRRYDPDLDAMVEVEAPEWAR
jgi:hypothetical protein